MLTESILVRTAHFYKEDFLKILDEVLQTGTADIPDSDLEIITAIAEEYVAEIFRRLREH